MKENTESLDGPETIMVHLFNVERFNRANGRLLTLVESLGLPEGQERAHKSLVQQELWDLWEHPWGIEEKHNSFVCENEDCEPCAEEIKVQ